MVISNIRMSDMDDNLLIYNVLYYHIYILTTIMLSFITKHL